MSFLNTMPALGLKKKQRLGRGRGSGRGGTSTKGHKGQKARSGVHIPNGFEGGQMSLARRLPKFGFTNKRFKNVYSLVSTKQFDHLKSFALNPPNTIDLNVLIKAGFMKKKGLVKVLNGGALKQAWHIKAHKFSRSARQAIEQAGGSVEEIKSKTAPKPKLEAGKSKEQNKIVKTSVPAAKNKGS